MIDWSKPLEYHDSKGVVYPLTFCKKLKNGIEFVEPRYLIVVDMNGSEFSKVISPSEFYMISNKNVVDWSKPIELHVNGDTYKARLVSNDVKSKHGLNYLVLASIDDENAVLTDCNGRTISPGIFVRNAQ